MNEIMLNYFLAKKVVPTVKSNSKKTVKKEPEKQAKLNEDSYSDSESKETEAKIVKKAKATIKTAKISKPQGKGDKGKFLLNKIRRAYRILRIIFIVNIFNIV